MNGGHAKMTLQTALVISGAVALACLILLWALTGFGFWSALFIGLLIGIAAFIFMLVFYTDGSLDATKPGHPAAARQVEESRAADETGAADKVTAESMARPAGGAAAKGASVADTAEPEADATRPGSGAGTGAAGAEPKPGAAGASEVEARPGGSGATQGGKPAPLSEARDGKPDNLKEIKGIGPKLEKQLNEMGYYHFDQIAAWTPAEVAWVDENLQGFKGRVSRDNWVEQARILAAGGDTEFSKKVDKGDVY